MFLCYFNNREVEREKEEERGNGMQNTWQIISEVLI